MRQGRPWQRKAAESLHTEAECGAHLALCPDAALVSHELQHSEWLHFSLPARGGHLHSRCLQQASFPGAKLPQQHMPQQSFRHGPHPFVHSLLGPGAVLPQQACDAQGREGRGNKGRCCRRPSASWPANRPRHRRTHQEKGGAKCWARTSGCRRQRLVQGTASGTIRPTSSRAYARRQQEPEDEEECARTREACGAGCRGGRGGGGSGGGGTGHAAAGGCCTGKPGPEAQAASR
jgi:hypothetical protein